jgi:hypothetical protein
MRTRWLIAIHDENQSEESLITEDHFVHFADVHQRMKRNKEKISLSEFLRLRSQWRFKPSTIFDGWATA